MKMKKRVSICIFCALFGGLLGFGAVKGISYLKQINEDKISYQQEKSEESLPESTEKLVSSIEVETAYSYVMVEENGYVVVYHRDMQTIFLEPHIPIGRLSEDLQNEISIGKKFESVEAVYDFLENYSS